MRNPLFSLALLGMLTSCTGLLTPGDFGDDTTDPDPEPTPTLAITSPAAGSSFERTELSADFEYRTTPLVFQATTDDPDIVEVEYLTESGFSLGIGVAPDFQADEPFLIDGLRTITAHARNAVGEEVATATINFTITPPVDDDCIARLTAGGADFSLADSQVGVHTAVRFKSPLAGITYLPFGASSPKADGEFASCALAETLMNMGPLLTAQGITTIEHLGIYNFRCIGGGDPRTDGCNPSQHAFATGIDIHELRDAAGTTFNVETDFVINADGNTCSATTSNDKDSLLHQIACEIQNPADLFHIVLTPNFNSAHRNHFHVDLTEGSDFIRSRNAHVDVAPVGVPVGH